MEAMSKPVIIAGGDWPWIRRHQASHSKPPAVRGGVAMHPHPVYKRKERVEQEEGGMQEERGREGVWMGVWMQQGHLRKLLVTNQAVLHPSQPEYHN